MSATVGLCQFHSFTHLTHNLTCLHTTCDSENPIQKQYKFLWNYQGPVHSADKRNYCNHKSTQRANKLIYMC